MICCDSKGLLLLFTSLSRALRVKRCLKPKSIFWTSVRSSVLFSSWKNDWLPVLMVCHWLSEFKRCPSSTQVCPKEQLEVRVWSVPQPWQRLRGRRCFSPPLGSCSSSPCVCASSLCPAQTPPPQPLLTVPGRSTPSSPSKVRPRLYSARHQTQARLLFQHVAFNH